MIECHCQTTECQTQECDAKSYRIVTHDGAWQIDQLKEDDDQEYDAHDLFAPILLS
jgi:hypothetical protein